MFLFKIKDCMHSLWPLSQWWWSGLSPASQEPRPRHWHVFAASLWLSILTDWPLCATPGQVNVPILCTVLNRSDSVVQDVLEILNLPTSRPFGWQHSLSETEQKCAGVCRITMNQAGCYDAGPATQTPCSPCCKGLGMTCVDFANLYDSFTVAGCWRPPSTSWLEALWSPTL